MLRKIAMILLVMGLMMTGLLAQENDKTRKDEMDEDLEELGRELKPEPIPEEVNILEILNQIQEKMTDAADGLSRTSVWKAIKDQQEVDLTMQEIIKRQKEAIKKLNKSFKNTQAKQKNAVDDITKLIRLARKMQQQSQSQQQPQPSPQEQPSTPQQKPTTQPQTGSQPAKRPYEATTQPPGVGKHITGLSDRWGNLPPKLREAIILSKMQEFTMEYQEWLERYFKILAEE